LGPPPMVLKENKQKAGCLFTSSPAILLKEKGEICTATSPSPSGKGTREVF
jgi:hypothetical protein